MMPDTVSSDTLELDVAISVWIDNPLPDGDNEVKDTLTILLPVEGPVATSRKASINSAQDVSLAPNPANASAILSLTMNQQAPVAIQVMDLQGRTVYQQQEATVQPGEHAFALPTGQWNEGLYVVRTRVGNEFITRKLIVN
jgi:hypothetical protein